MDTPMAVSREKIKALRDARAWSQAHLAEAASLSLRTVQRVEAEGTASAETRLAIAAALGVSVDELNAPPPVAAPEPAQEPLARPEPGPFNTLLILCNFGVALVYVLWMGRGLPPEVASHFGVAGDANGTMSRDGFVVCMLAVMIGLPMAIWSSTGWTMRHGLVNIPNAEHWFAGPRRAETERYLYRHITWFCVGMTAFMAWIFWLVAAANAGAPAHPVLDARLATIGMGMFLAAVTAWVVTLSVRFRRRGA